MKPHIPNIILLHTFLLTLTLITNTSSTFNKSLLRYVDKHQNHFLVTGNSIVDSNGQFQYYEVKQQLQNFVNVGDCRVVSISLLEYFPWPQETKEKYIEENFYNTSPGRPNQATIDRMPSYYFNYPVSGSWIPPSIFPNKFLKRATHYHKLLNSDHKTLQQIFEKIKTQFSYNLNSVVYVHNMNGFDGVNYVAAAYHMKYLGVQFKDAMRQIYEFYQEAGNTKGFPSSYYYGLQWYCLGLGSTPEQCLIGHANSKQQYQL